MGMEGRGEKPTSSADSQKPCSKCTSSDATVQEDTKPLGVHVESIG